jgi:hypothetical protein
LLETIAVDAFKDAPAPRYVEHARRRISADSPDAPPQPFDILLVNGRTRQRNVALEEMSARLATHNPLYPGDIVFPFHNDDARFPKTWGRWGIPFARINLWTLWVAVYLAIIFAGVLLTVITSW